MTLLGQGSRFPRSGLMTPPNLMAQPIGGVFCLWWTTVATLPKDYQRALSTHELARAEELCLPMDRVSAINGFLAVRGVAAAYQGIEPRDVRVERRCATCGGGHGRPEFPDTPELSISLSRTRGAVALAVSTRVAVGLDIEECQYAADLRDVILHPVEREALLQLDGAKANDFVLRTWVRKEALLKAVGVGLTVEPSTLIVTPAGGAWGSSAASSIQGHTQELGRAVTLIRDLDGPPGYVGSVAAVAGSSTESGSTL